MMHSAGTRWTNLTSCWYWKGWLLPCLHSPELSLLWCLSDLLVSCFNLQSWQKTFFLPSFLLGLSIYLTDLLTWGLNCAAKKGRSIGECVCFCSNKLLNQLSCTAWQHLQKRSSSFGDRVLVWKNISTIINLDPKSNTNILFSTTKIFPCRLSQKESFTFFFPI